MTRQFAYVVRPTGNLSPGRAGQAGSGRAVHGIIPGSVVRGALGAAWWTSPTDPYTGPDPQDDFDRLFGRQMIVGQADPRVPASPVVEQRLATLVPTSVARCKYADACGVVARDLAQVEGEPRKANPDEPCHQPTDAAICAVCERCPKCRIPAEFGHGWKLDWTTRATVTRTELEGEVPKEQMLFTREVLRGRRATSRSPKGEDIVYVGSLSVADDTPEHVVRWVVQSRVVRIGGSKTTMGRCTLDVVEELRPELETPSGRVAFYLQSPAILLDGYGAPSLDLGAEAVRISRSAGAESATLVRHFVRSTLISTWHGLAGLPKPQDWAVAAGGVVVLDGLTTEATRELLRGIGIRRNEGYGVLSLDMDDRVEVNWPQLTHHDSPVSAGSSAPLAGEPAGGAPTGTETGAEDIPAAEATAVVTEEAASAPAAREDEDADAGAVAIASRILGERRDEARRSLIRKLIPQARHSKRYRENSAESMIAGHIDRALGLPWARDLSGVERDLVADFLRAEDVANALVWLEYEGGRE